MCVPPPPDPSVPRNTRDSSLSAPDPSSDPSSPTPGERGPRDLRQGGTEYLLLTGLRRGPSDEPSGVTDEGIPGFPEFGEELFQGVSPRKGKSGLLVPPEASTQGSEVTSTPRPPVRGRGREESWGRGKGTSKTFVRGTTKRGVRSGKCPWGPRDRDKESHGVLVEDEDRGVSLGIRPGVGGKVFLGVGVEECPWGSSWVRETVKRVSGTVRLRSGESQGSEEFPRPSGVRRKRESLGLRSDLEEEECPWDRSDQRPRRRVL